MKRKPHLRLYPDTVLRQKALPVADIDKRVRALVKGMARIMYNCDGIGLAAPQMGVMRRVIIADIGEGLLSLINPEILDYGPVENLREQEKLPQELQYDRKTRV